MSPAKPPDGIEQEPPPLPEPAGGAAPNDGTDSTSTDSPAARAATDPPRLRPPASTVGAGRDIRDSEVHVKNIQNIKNVLLDGGLQHSFSTFVPKKMGVTIDREAEIAMAGQFFHEKGFVEECLNVLQRSRLMILLGEVDCGKQSMARYLANRLRQDPRVEEDTLILTPVPANIRLNMNATLREHQDMAKRVVIVPDALEGGNSGVRDFLSALKGEAIADLGRDLARVNSYVILTAVPASLPPGCLSTMPEWLRPSIPELSPDLRTKAVERRITVFLSQHPDLEALGTVSQEIREKIAKLSKSVSRAVMFIDTKLIAVIKGETTVEQAFDALDAQVFWFQNSADTNREAWMYALALIVSHSLGVDGDVPWSEFHAIYAEVREHLLKERNIKDRERPFDEDRLREAAGVEIKRDPAQVRDLVGFKEPGAARRLWDVLLTRFRPIAKSLVPVLLELTRSNNVMARARAAQALGRIGWLDAEDLTAQWLRDWSDSDRFQQRALAGYLAEGVFSLGDQTYRAYTLSVLDRFARDPDRAWTAIAAYKQIGKAVLPTALEKLRAIAERHLVKAFEHNLDFEREVNKLDRALGKSRSEEAADLRETLGQFRVFYQALFNKQWEIAESLKFGLVSLSMTCGLDAILDTLRRWAIQSNGMGALVCYVFVSEGGIADELTSRQVGVLRSDGPPIECSAAVASILEDTRAIQSMVKFLETLYAVLLEFFPVESAAFSTRLLFDWFEGWVEDSLGQAATRATMVEFVGRLLQSNVVELRDRAYDWLSAGSAFSKREMAAFAKDARRFRAGS